MAKFAPIAPLPVQVEMEACGFYGDLHMLLAHDVLAHEDEYRRFYSETRLIRRELDYPPPIVIVDNSLVELGEPLRGGDIVRAVKAVSATYAILPDVLRCGEETNELSLVAYHHVNLPLGVTWIYVVQGMSWSEMDHATETFIEFSGGGLNVGMLAIPRAAQSSLGTRRGITSLMFRKWNRPIHLLGFSDDIADDIRTARYPCVYGIDSAFPLWFGYRGGLLRGGINRYEGVRDWGKRPDSFWSETKLDIRAAANILRVREWMGKC